MGKPEIVIVSDPALLAMEAARRFCTIAASAVARNGRFSAALAGGSTPAGLYRLLARNPLREQIDWRNTLLYLGDERCVTEDDARSNTRMIREALLEESTAVPTTLRVPHTELPPAEAAAAYSGMLRHDFRLKGSARPRFDLVLLGVGSDGHTASLFPGMPSLDEKRRLAVATEVPDYVHPAVPRITLTLPVLNAAHHVIFLVSGASKAPAVESILAGPASEQPLPASRVKPVEGQVTWLLDHEAAARLR